MGRCFTACGQFSEHDHIVRRDRDVRFTEGEMAVDDQIAQGRCVRVQNDGHAFGDDNIFTGLRTASQPGRGVGPEDGAPFAPCLTTVTGGRPAMALMGHMGRHHEAGIDENVTIVIGIFFLIVAMTNGGSGFGTRARFSR